MEKYYTRACNFYYGQNSVEKIKTKTALPLNGNKFISFDSLEIINKSGSKIYHIKSIKKLNKKIKKKKKFWFKKNFKKKIFEKNKFFRIPNFNGGNKYDSW